MLARLLLQPPKVWVQKFLRGYPMFIDVPSVGKAKVKGLARKQDHHSGCLSNVPGPSKPFSLYGTQHIEGFLYEVMDPRAGLPFRLVYSEHVHIPQKAFYDSDGLLF